ncbi:uncharacterized protein BX664DRAFT_283144 [Halteromyces radiatus]|uniref:uncharacterized protein n=1 Tax=Halteromyces radiatus TaxID=101107 RepID=UPI002220053B|nr:uncharacterized protein BX664DRAFT_283144 [Halteromyces radiatus]KAI8084522.1 hypothetical protein BX664DRAFT_283144 [Halteromyces radiatus]
MSSKPILPDSPLPTSSTTQVFNTLIQQDVTDTSFDSKNQIYHSQLPLQQTNPLSTQQQQQQQHTPPGQSPISVERSKLPLRKRLAKDQKPISLQWMEPVKTENTQLSPHTEPSLSKSLPHPSVSPIEQPPTQYSFHNSNSSNIHLETDSAVRSQLPTSPKPKHTTKKKHNNIDENGRPIKKTKRGRPPLSSTTSSKKIILDQTNDVVTSENTPISKKSTSSTELYCFCQKVYDETQFMIACDRCEKWFHGDCIGIDEKQGEAVDLYFCPSCSKISGKQTSWKAKCSNPSCQNVARGGKNKQSHGSKYCQDKCGLQVARARLVLSDRKQQQEMGELASFSTRMEQLSKSRLSLFADRDDRRRLIRIRMDRQRAIDIIHQITLKQQFLQALMETMDPTNDQCGFDSRLLWEDDPWDSVTGLERQPTLRLLPLQEDTWTVCHQKSKRCQRHSGWTKLKTAELEQEREEQFVILSILARERKLIKTRMNNRVAEMNVARSLMNGTLVHNQ